MRWTELSPAWQACLEETWEAYCQGTMPVGAVVTDASGGIVSRGRNRIRERSAPGQQVCNNELAHAELNALLGLESYSPEIHSYAVYTSVEPCPLCMGAIYMSGVRRVYFASRDAYAGSTNLLGTTPYLARKPVQAFGPFLGGLAEFACALHIEFCLRVYSLPNPVIEMERQEFPDGVALAEKGRAGELFQQWATQGLTAAQAFDHMSALMS